MSRKSMRWKGFRISEAVILVVFFTFFVGADAAAQMPPGPPVEGTEAVSADALSCWWKTDKSSVRIGEEFTVTLTCRSAETGRERTVLNESLLDPGVIAFSPYQVKDGRRYRDLVRVLPGPEGPVTLHHVQFAYRLKLIDEGFFGKEVPLPPPEIRYRIDFVTNQDTVTPGKERTYILSPLPIRIQSLVPKGANAIRDAGNETFGDIEHRRRYAVIAFMAAAILLLLLLVVMLPRLVRVIRGRRESVVNGTVFNDKGLLRLLSRELNRVEKNLRTSSWDDASIGTALSVFRVAGAMALGHRVIQTPVEIENRGRQGQLKFRKGIWPRTKVLVSAGLTPEKMADELASADRQGDGKGRRKALLDEAQRAFTAFNQARYATAGNAARQETLDGALEKGLLLLRELRRERCRAVRMARAVTDLCARWRRKWKRS